MGGWECGSVADAVAAGVAVPVGAGVAEADMVRAEFGVRVAVANSWFSPSPPGPNRISAAARASNVNPAAVPSANACWRNAPVMACNGFLVAQRHCRCRYARQCR